MSCESDLDAALDAANAAHDTEVDDAVADMLEAIAACNSANQHPAPWSPHDRAAATPP